MPSPGFAAPGILFLNTWAHQERVYLSGLLRAARGNGYERYREGATGAFGATLIAKAVGYDPAGIETADVWFYSAVVGALLGGRDLASLGMKVDGEPFRPNRGEPVLDAAAMLVEELRLRFAKRRGKAAYHEEMYRALEDRREQAEADVADKLRGTIGQLAGLTHRHESPWEALARVADDPSAILVVNPPCYRGQYERVFDTDGRLTWDSPAYSIWDSKTDGPAFMERGKSAKGLVLMLQMAANGKPPGGVAWAASRPPQVSYLCANRPEEARELAGVSAGLATAGRQDRLPMEVLRPDDRVTLESTVEVVPIETRHARYYRDLWQHRMYGSGAEVNWAVLVDGKLAGVAGYSASALNRPYSDKWAGHLILIYCFGSPGSERRTKLVTMLAAQEETVRRMCDPWTAIRATGVVTINYTVEPEAKGFRGTPFKLIERRKHPVYQQELVYAAPLVDWGWQGALEKFVASEGRRSPVEAIAR